MCLSVSDQAKPKLDELECGISYFPNRLWEHINIRLTLTMITVAYLNLSRKVTCKCTGSVSVSYHECSLSLRLEISVSLMPHSENREGNGQHSDKTADQRMQSSA